MTFHTAIYDVTHAFLMLAEVKNVVRNLSSGFLPVNTHAHVVFNILNLNYIKSFIFFYDKIITINF